MVMNIRIQTPAVMSHPTSVRDFDSFMVNSDFKIYFLYAFLAYTCIHEAAIPVL